MTNLKVILFGSIGTLVETSDIQRKAFNEAFKTIGLDWYWDELEYKKLLEKSGGANRINEYSKDKNTVVDGKKIRNLKTKIFNEYLNKNKLKPRKGVLDIIKFSKQKKIKIGFVSSTTTNNINSIFNTLKKSINKKEFDFIGNNELVLREKPHPDIYNYSINYFKVEPHECIAIEDTEESLNSAVAANIKCIAFPGKYHEKKEFKGHYKYTQNLTKDLFK